MITHTSFSFKLRTQKKFLFATVSLSLSFLCLPPVASAATNLQISGWIPYWEAESGSESARDNMRKLDTINPFVYNVESDGSLKEMSDLDDRDWRTLFREADRRDVDVIPTVAWFDGVAIHTVLSDEDRREKHIEEIVDIVEDGDFDGVDIDYESKLAETKDYFSEFLEELKDELGSKTLSCTLEPRTPPESKYRTVPALLEYANDFEAINEHCDVIEIMAYDQQRIDWRLNDAKSGAPYIPVADSDWVEKVLVHALEDIDADKIMLGIPTYGREWELKVAPNWYRDYVRITALNLPDVEDILDEYEDLDTGRNKSGEMNFTYFPEDSIFKILNSLPTPAGTQKGNEAAAKALLFANATGMEVPVRVVWYSDASSVEDKVKLAEKYDLRGVALFKIDGNEDEDIWDLF